MRLSALLLSPKNNNPQNRTNAASTQPTPERYVSRAASILLRAAGANPLAMCRSGCSKNLSIHLYRAEHGAFLYQRRKFTLALCTCQIGADFINWKNFVNFNIHNAERRAVSLFRAHFNWTWQCVRLGGNFTSTPTEARCETKRIDKLALNWKLLPAIRSASRFTKKLYLPLVASLKRDKTFSVSKLNLVPNQRSFICLVSFSTVWKEINFNKRKPLC